MKSISTLILIGLVSKVIGETGTPYFTELETLNPSQAAALKKFKKSVSSAVPHDYMKEDIYLVKWLQASGFSVRKAEEMIKNAMKWREQMKVDKWEDPQMFADIEKKGEYPLFDDGVDREGRPGLPLYLGFVSQYEKYWPNTIYRTLLINTPDSFELILNLIRPLMSPQTRAGLRIFGANKSSWKPYLDELIDPTEISDWYDPNGKERRV